MSETDLWQELSDGLLMKWHVSRVESHATSAGIPDVDFCMNKNGKEGHIELKYGHVNGMPKIRSSQIRWHMRRYNAGGRSFFLSKIMNGKDGIYMLHRGKYAVDMDLTSEYDYWHATALVVWYINIDFNELQHILEDEI